MPELNEIIEIEGLSAPQSISKFVAFEKINKEERLVYGTISSENLDSQNQIVEAKAIEDALADYMKYGNIREMHQPRAVGKAKNVWFEDGLWKICAKIVDNAAWEKVKEGVYNGFSIGGKTKPGGIKKVQQDGKYIERLTAIEMTEISLADRPANGDATFDMWKVAGIEPQNQENQEGGAAAMPPELENKIESVVEKVAETPVVETPVEETPAATDQAPAEIAKAALDAAFAEASAKVEAAAQPVHLETPAPAASVEVNKAAEGSAAEEAAETPEQEAVEEMAETLAVLTQLQEMRNEAELAGKCRKASLLGSACSAIVYFLAALKSPNGSEYDFSMSALIEDLAKSQQASELAVAKVAAPAEPEPDQGLENIQKAVVDGLGIITEKLGGMAERIDNLERQPAAGGPVLRAVEKSFSISTGLNGSQAPVGRDERATAIEELQKMHGSITDPIRKAAIGEVIAEYQIKNTLGFRN